MKIHFSNVDFRSSTGPNTFAQRLANSLRRRGYDIVSQDNEYDVFLAFIEPASIPKPGTKIIQRLDGIWFKPEEFHEKNQNIKWLYDRSNSIVWQSNFDKKMTEKYWGERSGKVIHNGIEIKSVTISDPVLKKIREQSDRIFVCSASWHRQKRLKENIEFYLKNRRQNDTLLVLGKNPDFLVEGYNIFYLGQCSHETCLQIYSASDWMIHLAWLDHCPNVVVEAMSQGCPVICTDSGGTQEIVGRNGIILREDTPYDFSLLDYDSPYSISSHLRIQNLDKLEVNFESIDIEKVCDQYEEIIKWG